MYQNQESLLSGTKLTRLGTLSIVARNPTSIWIAISLLLEWLERQERLIIIELFSFALHDCSFFKVDYFGQKANQNEGFLQHPFGKIMEGASIA